MTRQNYYATRRRRQRQDVEAQLVVEHVQEERKLQPRLGTRKLHHLLRAPLAQAGVKLGRDRMFEVLRAHALLVAPRRAEYPCTTDSSHYLPVFTNREKDREVSAPHQVWVADLTYLRTLAGFLYLALLTDKKSRKIVGYHCSETLETRGCVPALEMALGQLPAGARPLHHSDRGCQYCSHEYVNHLVAHGLEVSMTEQNHCAENALAERMNGILKSEYGLGREFATKDQARRAVEQAVFLYNTRRPHSALGYAVPEAVHRRAA
jgi:putative transposase